MAKQSNRESVVKRGGMAREPSDAEDVTRDTYGDLKPAPVNRDKEKRAAEASRLAAAAGIPVSSCPTQNPTPAASRRKTNRKTVARAVTALPLDTMSKSSGRSSLRRPAIPL
jgi:hypothetical protein